jgi:hypothetical protein
MTEECTDGYLQSVFQTLTDTFTDGMNPSVRMSHYHRWDKSVGIFQAGNFFLPAISVCKTIGKCFFIFPTDIATDSGVTDERKADGRILSVRMSINKLPTKS